MNKDTINFINHHKINSEIMFDAKGQGISKVKDEMKLKDKLFAYNAVPCGKGNHTIRDRYNHCIVCNTAHITFAKRTAIIGYIYIVGSIKQNLIKVGMTTEFMETRIAKLNSMKVGNTNDWVMLKSIKCESTNKVEIKIHKELFQFKVEGNFYGGVESNELFKCNFTKAKETTEKVLKDLSIVKIEEKNFLNNFETYNSFKNISRK